MDSPINPKEMDWSQFYPEKKADERVEFADIGCGYGGLLGMREMYTSMTNSLVSLASVFPEKYMLGMEIRVKVTEYVKQRIVALRANSVGKSVNYQNISIIRANAMKFLPNFFEKGQLGKIFFLFPDPHFKKKKHKARIISSTLLSEYAHVLRPGGLVYTVTDVLDLHEWMKSHLDEHPLFERVLNDSETIRSDPVIPCVMTKTEEGLKVEREGGQKYLAVYRRIEE